LIPKDRTRVKDASEKRRLATSAKKGLSIVELANRIYYFTRGASANRIRRQSARHNRICTNNSILANSYTLQDAYISTDPYTVHYDDRG
jgi:hypothetical protein